MIGLLLVVSLATKGTICFNEKECVPTIGPTFEIKPGDVERRFVWTSDDGASVVLEIVPISRIAPSVRTIPETTFPTEQSTLLVGRELFLTKVATV